MSKIVCLFLALFFFNASQLVSQRITLEPMQGQMNCIARVHELNRQSFALGIPETIGSSEGMILNFPEAEISWQGPDANGVVSHSWLSNGKIFYAVKIIPERDYVDIEMTIKNISGNDWTNVFSFNCLNPINADKFKDWDLIRTFMSKDGKPFRMDGTTRINTGQMKTVQFYLHKDYSDVSPFVKGFGAISPDRTDDSYMVTMSDDMTSYMACTSPSAVFLFDNLDRCCIHSATNFGNIPKDGEKTVTSRFYFAKGSLDDFIKRFEKEVKNVNYQRIAMCWGKPWQLADTEKWSKTYKNLDIYKFYIGDFDARTNRDSAKAFISALLKNDIKIAVEIGGLLDWHAYRGNQAGQFSFNQDYNQLKTLIDLIKEIDPTKSIDMLDMDGPIRRMLYPNDKKENYHTIESAVIELFKVVKKWRDSVPGIELNLLTNFPNWAWGDTPAYFKLFGSENGYGRYEEILDAIKAKSDETGLMFDALTIDNPYDYATGKAQSNQADLIKDVDWMKRIAELSSAAKTMGLKVNMIFNTNGGRNAKGYSEQTLEFLKLYQESMEKPDGYWIQSWYQLPEKWLPEDEDYTMTNLTLESIKLIKKIYDDEIPTDNDKIGIELGVEEIVFEYTNDACVTLDLPDVYAHAIRTPNSIVLASGNAPDNYFMFGADFNSLERSCEPVFRSGDKWPVDAFDHQEWITSLYSEDGITIHALVHNEYHDPYAENCKPGVTDPSNPCWYNFISYAVSSDGGRSFTQPKSPEHLVAMLPFRWNPSAVNRGAPPPHGYFEPSNIIKHNGYYYCLMFGITSNTSQQQSGTCIMRTDDLSSPGSWKIWDGKGFNIPLINPYTDVVADSSTFLPAFISRSTIRSLRGSVTWNSYFEKFMLVGAGVHPVEGVETCGFFFSLSDDLLNWSQPQLIRKTILGWSPCNTQTPEQATRNIVQEAYPSLIDHDSPDISFSTADSTAYLYFMQNMDNWKQGGWGFRRNLVRIPIKFVKGGSKPQKDLALLEPGDGRVYHGVQLMTFDSGDPIEGYLHALNDSTIQPAVRGLFFSIPGTRGPANSFKALEEFYKDADSIGFIPELSLFLVSDIATDSIIAVSDTYDWIIDSVITLTKNYGKSVFLRIGGEFNGSGPGWNGGGYHPYIYVNMFQKIVNMFAVQGLRDSIAVIWCYEPDAPNDFDSVDSRGARWYPGDEYVDWFGLDVFDAGHFDQELPDYDRRGITRKGKSERFLAMARAKNKPVYMSETSAIRVNISEDEEKSISDWNGWFAKFFEFIGAHKEIKGFSYINANWPQGAYPEWGDARIQNSPYITQKYREEMRKPKYIHLPVKFDTTDYKPEKVALVSPKNGAEIDDGKVTLVWNKANPDTEHYKLGIYIGRAIIYFDSTLTDTTFTYNKLQNNNEYSWRVQAKNSFGWGKWSDVWIFSTKDATSVEETARDGNRLIITPNPASDYIEINNERCATLGKCGTSEIKLYNTFGECVLNVVGVELALPKSTRAELAPPLQKIDISHLPVGIYFIQIGNYSEKFIVVR